MISCWTSLLCWLLLVGSAGSLVLAAKEDMVSTSNCKQHPYNNALQVQTQTGKFVPQHNSKISFLLSTCILSNKPCWFQISNFQNNRTISWHCAAVWKFEAVAKIFLTKNQHPKPQKQHTLFLTYLFAFRVSHIVTCLTHYLLLRSWLIYIALLLLYLHCLPVAHCLFTWRVIFTR